MNRKKYTILITSNRKGTTRSLTITSAWLKTAGFLTAVMMVILSALVVDYVGLLVEAGQNKKLKAQASRLTRQFKMVESKLEALEKSLERVNTFTKKLKIITNIEDEDRDLNAIVGPMPKLGQNLNNEMKDGDVDRIPSNYGDIGFSDDKLFFDKPILDRVRGEISSGFTKDYSTLAIRIKKAVQLTQLREESVLNLREILMERQSLINATPRIKPTRGWFTSLFGYRLDPFTSKPQMHTGLDIAAAPGTPVKSPADGIISNISYEAGYGKLVSIDHGYGVVTRYAHNSQVFVELGQKVKTGDVVSAVGSTGRSSGPHLHYEVRVQGVAVDPINYIPSE